jgi:hypothetical protein
VSTKPHGGRSSFRFDHRTERKNDHFKTLSQRVHPLTRGTAYIVTFWAKGNVTDPDAFFVTTDYPWADHESVALTTEWKPYSHRFNSGRLDYADIRFVIQASGTVWLDDVDVREDQ